jgi:peptide/nickel transport system substrate-binding protein
VSLAAPPAWQKRQQIKDKDDDMKKELTYLAGLTAKGRMDRRGFLGRAGALGASSLFATGLMSQAVLAAGPKKGGTLSIAMSGGQSTDTLDPALAANEAMFMVLRHFGDTLVEVAPDGSLNLRLATAVRGSVDAKVWTFTIRKGVSFHNGKTLTPSDVVATLRRHSGDESKSGALGQLRAIQTVEASGDDVIITLNEGNADLPYIMSDYHLVIQPGGGVEAPDSGIGTGPYRVVSVEHGVRYAFEKNDDYFDDSRGHAAEIEMLVISDDTARAAALQSGQVDMINRIPPKVAGLIVRAPGITVHSAAGRSHYAFLMHANTAPFDNNDLRLALKYAMDREQMVKKILFGHGSLGNDMPINAAYPLFSDDIEQRTYDPEKAAAHYRASGHEGPVVLRTADTSFPGAVDAAQLFQQSALAAGINIEIKREPNDGYWSEVWNNKPFCTSYWGGRPTQDGMYSTAYLSSADWNDTRFFNDRFDANLLRARSETNTTKRKAIYREMGVTVRDTGGLLCPMFANWVEGTSRRVAGWHDDPSQNMMNGFATIKCWLTA